MIDPYIASDILRLYHAEKWLVGTIASHLGIHRDVVERVIADEEKGEKGQGRPRLVDPYVPFILEMLGKYRKLTAGRLYDMVKERGYKGKPDHFRTIVASLRPIRPQEAYLRLRTLPAEDAQVDWGHFGRIAVGKALRPLYAFVMVLSFSRAIFLRFFLSQTLSSFLYGHEFAFRWFSGVPRRLLYDNLKAVVLERIGPAIRFNPVFLEFAGRYRFEPRPVNIARGNEKGRVERAIRYIRSRFFRARRYKDLDDLNRQALTWCETTSLERKWPEDSRRTVGDVFLEEKGKLMALPADPYPCHERVEAEVGKSPYVRFDKNDYSVPHTLARRTLVVLAGLNTVRILNGNDVVAAHPRSYDQGAQIEDPTHIEELAAAKAAAGEQRRTDRLAHLVPVSSTLLEQMAERGFPLGRSTKELMDLLQTYGPEELESAIEEALRSETPHTQAVRHILDRTRREAGKPPARPLLLPDDPRVRDASVRPHTLESYDTIKEETDDDSTEERAKSA